LSGEPLRRRDGQPLASRELTRVKLPVCLDCNHILEARFERPGRELVYRLFSDGGARFDGSEAAIVSLWLLKTWLLLCHPAIHYSQELVNDLDIIRRRPMLPVSCYQWMVDGSAPPAGLSLWLARSNDDRSPRTSMIPVPTVEADGASVLFAAHESWVHGLTICVAFHPGWDIDFPGVGDGRVVRLWPSPPPFDLGALPVLVNGDLPMWVEGWRVQLRNGVLGTGNLPALGAVHDGIDFAQRLRGYASVVTRVAT
jgi:hypothetical protein